MGEGPQSGGEGSLMKMEIFKKLGQRALIPAKLKFRRPVGHLLPYSGQARAREKAKLLETIALSRPA